MKNKLIIALDVDSFKRAKKLVDKLAPHAGIFKVGSELFTATGPAIIKYINKKRKKVFLDLKFFDIPNTVEKAALAAMRHGVFMLTVHVTGGFDMLKKAVRVLKGKRKKPLLIGVTVLTSKRSKNAAKDVIRLAKAAKKAGLDGIVCSAKETKRVKRACGRRLIVVNPGIRPRWAKKDDQKRVMTPQEAIGNGADFIVIGRPITRAADPATEAAKIIRECK